MHFPRTVSLLQARRGSALAVLAILMVPIIGVLALVLDGGLLMRERQHAQAVADAAAQAAAITLYQNNGSITSSTPDPGGQAKKMALASASANGYANDGATSTVTVNIPPKSGPNTSVLNYAEVIVQYSQSRAFSALWGSTTMSVSARSVSRGLNKSSGIGFLLLNSTMSGSLSATGNGAVNVAGGAVIVDSSSSSAVKLTGNGGVTAQNIKITGNYTTTGGGALDGTVKTSVSPTADPYASLTPPDPSTLTLRSSGGLSYSEGSYTLQPGVYQGGISLTGQASLTLQPGIYYLDGGGLSLTGQGSVTGNGVMIYNAAQSASDQISLTGQGNITLTPMTSGPYANFTIFQDRTSSATMRLTGNGGLSISGIIYGAKAPLSLTGNGSTDTYGWQIVADDASLTGNGAINVGKAGGVAAGPDIRIVE
jgi:Flp pilus assembly protein TadG